MMEHSEEEIARFVSENRDLIEMMMDRAEKRREDDYERLRYRLDGDVHRARSRVDRDVHRAEDTFREVFEAFADPEVQRHFVTMGMNFVMGMSALMQRMPGPDYLKSTASDFESGWRKAACGVNRDCEVRKRKIDIDGGAVKVPIEDSESERWTSSKARRP